MMNIRTMIASEFGFLVGPTMRKYGIVIVPTIASTIAAVDIINNQKHRQLLDKYGPMFVDLVRRYYGFVDEDINEINRIRCVEQQLRSPVTVSFDSRMFDSPKVFIHEDGSQRMDSLVDAVIADYGLDGIAREVVTRQLRFLDGEDESGGKDGRTVINHHIHSHNDTEGDVVVLTVMGTHASLYSALTSLCNNDGEGLHPHRAYSLPIINEVHVGLQSVIDSWMMGNRYDNFLSDFLAGLTSFETYSSIPVKGKSITKRPMKLTRSRGLSAVDVRPHDNSLRSTALQQISILEREIHDLEREKLVGRREIDAVEHDIMEKRTKITDLRRRYINYFYYF